MTIRSSSTNAHTRPRVRWREQRGVTLIELLVAMIMALVVSLAAFSILEFTSSDVSRITSRAHVDQTGRIALQKIMLALHSSCVALEVNPIVEGSSPTMLKFISQSGEQPALETVHEHVITYNSTAGTLTEQEFPSTGPETKEGNYPFSGTASSTTKLLTGIGQTQAVNETTHTAETLPIFQYYKYFQKGETIPTGESEPPYGKLFPAVSTGFTKEEAESVAKVTMSFTLKPEGTESVIAKGHQPIALEDSAVFRLTPASIEHVNSPCSEAP